MIPAVPITLADGRERTLRYTLGSLRRLKAMGVDLLAMPEDQILLHLADLLWAGLVTDDPTLTPEDVAELIPLADAVRHIEAFTKAFTFPGAAPHD